HTLDVADRIGDGSAAQFQQAPLSWLSNRPDGGAKPPALPAIRNLGLALVAVGEQLVRLVASEGDQTLLARSRLHLGFHLAEGATAWLGRSGRWRRKHQRRLQPAQSEVHLRQLTTAGAGSRHQLPRA